MLKKRNTLVHTAKKITKFQTHKVHTTHREKKQWIKKNKKRSRKIECCYSTNNTRRSNGRTDHHTSDLFGASSLNGKVVVHTHTYTHIHEKYGGFCLHVKGRPGPFAIPGFCFSFSDMLPFSVYLLLLPGKNKTKRTKFIASLLYRNDTKTGKGQRENECFLDELNNFISNTRLIMKEVTNPRSFV